MYKIINSSKKIKKHEKNIQPIILIYQYFIHKNKERCEEIKKCLKYNVFNKNISKIILLNEKIFNTKELGISSEKIEQININKRLQFYDIFDYVDKNNINGYIITCNADIFFNDTISNLYISGLDKEKKIYSQLRFEYTNKNTSKCKLFGPRCDSQDVWIFHSNFNIEKKYRKLFKIHYGIGGCDNKIIYLFDILNYKLENHPYFIKCFHYHKTQIRDYINKPRIPKPYAVLIPYIGYNNDNLTYPLNRWCLIKNLSYNEHFKNCYTDNTDMNKLINIIKKNKNFIINKTNLHNIHILYYFNKLTKINNKDLFQKTINNIQNSLNYLSTNSIILNNINLLNFYIQGFKNLLNNSDMNLNEPLGHSNFFNFYRDKNSNSLIEYLKTLKENNKLVGSDEILNIGHYIKKDNWINYIKNKKILIISKHYNEIKDQINKINKTDDFFYEKKHFIDCSFSYLNIPNNTNQEYDIQLKKYTKELLPELTEVDIVFIGETLYDFNILNIVHSMKKSGIVIGEYLPLYFGLYKKSDFQNWSDILKMYMNKNWKLIV